MSLYGQGSYNAGPYGLADYGPIYDLPVSYYLSLLTSQYRLAPNLNKWLAKKLQYLQDASTCLSSISESYDLDTAAGIQLDVLGVIAGVARTVPFQPTGGVSPVLDDTTYRLLIRATTAQNQWDGTESSLQPIWQSLFIGGRIVIVDNQNMSCTVVMSGVFTTILQDLIRNGFIVPRPEGVEYEYTFGDLPIFGTDENNAFIAGVDVGHLA